MKADQFLRLLRAYESRNVTFMDSDGAWPIVWKRAKGVHVWDTDGRRYLDLTAAFGVANAGHANSRVVLAAQRQMAKLLHAMGDVHPHELKAQLARELSRVTFGRWSRMKSMAAHPKLSPGKRGLVPQGKTLFCNSGFEAVEAALKTARLATGRRDIIAFEGAYHGVGYGALNATHRAHFKKPFGNQLGRFGRFAPYPSTDADLTVVEQVLRKHFNTGHVGAVIAEPVQGRGGIQIPPRAFLPLLRALCDEHSALLILDEVFTGFGRTGAWFACEHTGVAPDLICLGKALTGGFPLSACVGRAEIMDAAWPASSGEAIHTSTYLGHPVGCAMALAQISEIRRLRLVPRSATLGRHLLTGLQRLENETGHLTVRGLGLMAGIELCEQNGAAGGAVAMTVIKAMLRAGYILIPEGDQGQIISFTPPLTITRAQLDETLKALRAQLP